MILVDANVLLYAVDRSAAQHSAARTGLDQALSDGETVLFPWVALLAFLRLATHPGIFPTPLPTETAFDLVDSWLEQPAAAIPDPDERHAGRLRELLAATGRGGNLVNDAHLAALAIQYRATVLTFDSDFGRFPGVEWKRPTQ